MKVWVVLEYAGYEDCDIVGVFYKKEDAEKFIKDQGESSWTGSWDKFEWEVK